jgi:excisionase family DNA binding protein
VKKEVKPKVELDTMRVSEAAHQLQISEQTAYLWAKSGRLPAIYLGRSVRIPRKAFDRFLEAGR